MVRTSPNSPIGEVAKDDNVFSKRTSTEGIGLIGLCWMCANKNLAKFFAELQWREVTATMHNTNLKEIPHEP